MIGEQGNILPSTPMPVADITNQPELLGRHH